MKWTFRGYMPLHSGNQEIRLLKICEPSLELQHSPLATAPPFHAISYCWGPQNDLRVLWIDKRPFLATRHVCLLIDTLLQRDPGIYIWLDAICINQNDIDERSSQVTFMGDIYKKAEDVYAWLGASNEKMEYVFDALSDFETYRNHTDIKPEVMSPTPLRHEKLAAFLYQRWHLRRNDGFGDLHTVRLDHQVKKEAWHPLVDLVLRPNWRRVWIVQELLLPNTVKVLCGNRLADFEGVSEFSSVLWDWRRALSKHNDNDLLQGWRAMNNIRNDRDRTKSAQGPEFLPRELDFWQAVVMYCESHECSNQLDKVYGFRGVCSDLRTLPVDYSKSVIDVFIEYIAFAMKSEEFSWSTAQMLQKWLGLTHLDQKHEKRIKKRMLHELNLELRTCRYIKRSDFAVPRAFSDSQSTGNTVNVVIEGRNKDPEVVTLYELEIYQEIPSIEEGDLLCATPDFGRRYFQKEQPDILVFREHGPPDGGQLSFIFSTWIVDSRSGRGTSISKQDLAGLQNVLYIDDGPKYKMRIEFDCRAVLAILDSRTPSMDLPVREVLE